jgi:AraC-like DNA-binding protein
MLTMGLHRRVNREWVWNPLYPFVSKESRPILVDGFRRAASFPAHRANRGDETMKSENFHWKGIYRFTEPGITAEGVRVYPFDPPFPIDVSFQKALGSRLVRLNRHEFFEIIYIYSGSTHIQVRDRVLPIEAGNVVVIGPNVFHRVLHKPNAEVKLISMNFQPEIARAGKAAGEEEYYLSPFLCQGSQFPHVISDSPELSREVFELMLKISRELPARTLLNRMAIRTYLRVALFLLFKHYGSCLGSLEMIERERRNLERLQPVFDLLERRFDQIIEVHDAARSCAMSSSHFMRFFKMTVGETFCAYLTSFRIAKAQYMLMDKEIPIAEISQRVGFCSQSYFGEVFRSLVGTTPRAYRQQPDLLPTMAPELNTISAQEAGTVSAQEPVSGSIDDRNAGKTRGWEEGAKRGVEPAARTHRGRYLASLAYP